MATTIITGGTDGIGRALADTYLDRGHDVLVTGTSTAKGEAFLASAAARGADDRGQFLPADLSLVAEILPFLDKPPARLTAVLEGSRVPTSDTAAFASGDAARLHELTVKLLADLPQAGNS